MSGAPKALARPSKLSSGRRPISLVLVVMVVASLLIGATVVSAQRDTALSAKADPVLAKRVAKGDSARRHQVVVRFKDAGRSVAGLSRSAVIRTLKSSARSHQAAFLKTTRSLRASGHVGAVHSFWITDAAVLSADRAALSELAELPQVASIIANDRMDIIPPLVPGKSRSTLTRPGGPRRIASGSEWNIARVRAPEVWSGFGVTGDGSKVAVIDTGIDSNHPDLSGKVSAFVRIDDLGNAASAIPNDVYGHGTHVSGTIAGGSASGKAIGVAPGAELIGVQALPEGSATVAQLLGALEYVADPDGNPGTPDAPDIANMSWGLPQTPIFLDPIDNLRDAGVLPVAAIGNSGPGTSGSPGDVPSTLAVGATDKVDSSAFFSSGVEVEWGDAPYIGTWIKPDISAPGQDVLSAYPGGNYMQSSGTSMASPHVAGIAALVLSSSPALSTDRVESLLRSSSVDLGAASKDTRFGDGRVDAYEAVSLAQAFGTVSGNIHGAGAVDLNARVDILTSPGGQIQASTIAGGDGEYRLALPVGDYRARVTAFGYRGITSDVIDVSTGDSDAYSPTLAAAAAYKLSGKVLFGSKVIEDAVVVATSPTGVAVDYESGAFSVTVPEGRYLLRATAPGYARTDVTIDLGAAAKVSNIQMVKVKDNLLVLDAFANDYEEEHADAMTAAGLSFDTVRIDPFVCLSSGVGVDQDELMNYKNVIWAAGDAMVTGAAGSFDMETGESTPAPLQTYLDSGGRLLLSGQDALFWMRYFGGGPFADDYLRVTLVADASKNMTVRGRIGGVWSGLDMNILRSVGEDGAGNQLVADVMKANDLGVFSEAFYTRDTRGAAAVRSNPNDDGRIFFAGFGLEGLDDDTERTASIKKVIDWFDAPAGSLSVTDSFKVVHDGGAVTLRGTLTPKVAGQRLRLEKLTGIRLSGESDFDEDGPVDFEEASDKGTSRGYGGMGGLRRGLTPEQRAKNAARSARIARDAGARLRAVITKGKTPAAQRAALAKMEADPIFVFTYEQIGVMKTKAGGKWSARMRPVDTNLLRVVWEGSATRSRAESGMVFVAVDPLVKMWKAKAGAVEAGSKVKLRGYIHPEPLGRTRVYLYSRVKGSSKWRLVKHVRSGPSGRFTATHRPIRNSYLRAIVGGIQYFDGKSNQVYMPTDHALSIWPETKLAPRGVRIWFSGRVLSAHSGARVELQVQRRSGWRTVGVDRLKGDGKAWSIPYSSSRRDAFRFRAIIRSDTTNGTGASRTVSVRFY